MPLRRIIIVIQRTLIAYLFSFSAEHVEPQFAQELENGRVREMENYVFTVAFAGNPKPEISWYHDNLLLHQHQAFQVRAALSLQIIFIRICS